MCFHRFGDCGIPRQEVKLVMVEFLAASASGQEPDAPSTTESQRRQIVGFLASLPRAAATAFNTHSPVVWGIDNEI
jgi:hypothetical protein